MRLRGQVVDFHRLNLLDEAVQVARIRQIAVMQNHSGILFMTVFIKMIDTVGVEGALAADNAVYLIPLLHQQFGQVRAVLTGYSGNQCFFHGTPLERVYYSTVTDFARLRGWSISHPRAAAI